MAAGGSPGGNLFTLALGIALAPVAGIVGAAVGAAKAHSEEEVATAQTQLATVWSKAKPTANLTAAFLERSQGMGWQTLAADDGATPMLVSTASGTGTAVSPNTKLRIGVEALELVYDGNFDPDVYVMMRTFARFSTVADDAELFRAKWTVVRKGAPYFTLAQRPQALQTQIDEVTATAAGSMANFLFAASSPVDARQEAHGGTILIEATTVALPSTPAAP